MSPSHRTFRARWIFVTGEQPLRDGFITVADGEIKSIHSRTDEPFRDLGDVGLLPGIVNAHTHLEFSDLAQPLGQPGMEFPKWLQLVIANRMARGSRPTESEIAKGLLECRDSGTVAIGEIATHDWTPPSQPNNVALSDDHVGAPVDARFLRDAQTPKSVSFYEWISLDPARQGDLEERQSRHRDRLTENPSFVEGVSPHAPYTLHPALFEVTCSRAVSKQLPIATHLAESLPELELLGTGQGLLREFLESLGVWREDAFEKARKPMWYLERLAKTPRSLIVHGNYLSESELDFLAANRSSMSLVYCPRTHHYFRHQPYPLLEALAKGVRVVLGTDSRASNPDLNLWNEFRFLVEQFPQVSVQQALQMITVDAAASLGMAPAVAMLAPGSSATVNLIPMASSAKDPWQALLDCQAPTLTNLQIK